MDNIFQYITNSKGQREAVIVPIDQYNSLIESQKRLKKLEKIDLSQEEKDPSKMSKEEFFAKIDKARAGKKIRMSREEMRKMLLSE